MQDQSMMFLRTREMEFDITSLGYRAPGLRDGSKPSHPSIPSQFFWTKNLSGSNSSGLSHRYGDLWRLYTCINANLSQSLAHDCSQAALTLSKISHGFWVVFFLLGHN